MIYCLSCYNLEFIAVLCDIPQGGFEPSWKVLADRFDGQLKIQSLLNPAKSRRRNARNPFFQITSTPKDLVNHFCLYYLHHIHAASLIPLPS